MRSWKILVRILEVGDPSIEGRSPGCLQWFTGETGRITSFNHLNGATQGNMLEGLDYSICIRPDGNLGCVDFRESGGTTDSFRLDGPRINSGGANANAASNTCTQTHVFIPNIGVAQPFYCGGVLGVDGETTSSVVRSLG